MYRIFAETVASLVRSEEDLDRMRRVMQPQRRAELLVQNMHRRYTSVFQNLNRHLQRTGVRHDVTVTVEQIWGLYGAIRTTFQTCAGLLSASSRADLLALPIDILESIVRYDYDVYASASSSEPTYATTRNNVYRTWISEGQPLGCIEVLGEMMASEDISRQRATVFSQRLTAVYDSMRRRDYEDQEHVRPLLALHAILQGTFNPWC